MDAWFMFIIGLIVLLVGITVLGSIAFILEFIHKSILEPILIWYDERRYARKNASPPEIQLDFDDDERCPCCGRRKYCHCDDDDYCDRCGQRKYRHHCDDERF